MSDFPQVDARLDIDEYLLLFTLPELREALVVIQALAEKFDPALRAEGDYWLKHFQEKREKERAAKAERSPN